MNPTDLRRASDVLDGLLQAATPRPWHDDGAAIRHGGGVVADVWTEADAALIVALRRLPGHLVDLLRLEANRAEGGVPVDPQVASIAQAILGMTSC